MPSSPDSSSDSSSSSPQNPYGEGPNAEAEASLPGVIMATKHAQTSFFFQLADLGMSLNATQLITNALNVLKIMPADQQTVSLKMRGFDSLK